MIKLSNINITFDEVLIENQEINIKSNEITLLYGKSGTGKTSLLYRIGLISLDKQEYQYHNIDISNYNDAKKSNIRQMNIGYVMQDNSLFEQYDVLGNLKLYASFSGKEYSDEQYQYFLDQVKLEIQFNQTIKTLSGGEKQRLAIACALCKDVEFLILDEPTSALDTFNAQVVLEVLNELKKNKTIFIVSHDVVVQDYADCIYCIEDKKLVCKKETTRKCSATYREKKHPLSLSFYLKYIKYFFNKYSIYNMFMIFVLFIVSCSVCVAMIYVNDLTNKNIQIIKDTSPNQLLVELNDDITNYLNENNLVKEIYTYETIKASFSDVYYDVIPYFNQSDLNSAIQTIFNVEGDTFTSATVYEEIFYSPNGKLGTLPLHFKIHDSYEIEGDVIIGGFLKESHINFYTHDEYIYVSNEYYQNLLEQSGMTEFEKFIIFLKDYDATIEVIELLEENNLFVEDGFNNIDNINVVLHEMNKLKLLILSIICFVSVFFLSILNVHYFYKRSIEFSLLKINGLNSNHILKLMFYEVIIKTVISVACSMVIFTFISIIYDVNNINVIYNIIVNIIFSMIVIIFTILFSFSYIKKLDSSSEIRF